MSDLLRSVAYVFRRRGEPALEPREFARTLAFDLGWFSPTDARRLLALAASRGLVLEENGKVRASFDPASVEIPVGFRPSPDTLAEPASVAREDTLLDRAAREAGAPAEALRREAQAERERSAGLLSFEAALVVAVARRGRDARALAAEARKTL